MPNRTLSFTILLLSLLFRAQAQSVYISPDINIKNDFSYYVLVHPNQTISLLRDKSFRLSLQTLYPDFQWSVEKNIELPGKKWRLLDLYEKGNDIGIFYVSRDDADYRLYYAGYNAQAALQSEKLLFEGVSVSGDDALKIQNSEDRNWIAIGFNDLKQNRKLLLYNRKEDSIYYTLNLKDLSGKDELQIRELELDNRGVSYLIGKYNEPGGSKKKSQTAVMRVSANGGTSPLIMVPMDEVQFSNGFTALDHRNDRLAIGGLYSDKNNQSPKGYALSYVHSDGTLTGPDFTPFSGELLEEWSGNNKKSVLNSSELHTRNIAFKQDGGCLIFYENIKELSRRPYFSNSDPTGAYASKWFDYYFDDILVASFDASGKLIWDRVLHKRQYSQDDEGLFSSFFIFRTNALLRIIFNDAISSEGTVSEYLMKPNGDQIRKSILNTSYKNLNLRFRDAIELDARSLLIPSESSGRLNLVKIVFE
ncbi:MAG TPA: hypothetical protein VFX48_02660 [Saprospiraceae bacterium]|nr:hypothetical protein [Saprospiraceae bacterium]